MAVKIIVGRAGSGKSTYICEKVSKAAMENPWQSYLVIVPDQFTMQTQADFVNNSPRGGIMNIEVLSFSRLAHRVYEETGGIQKPVLDDTGKNLIIRRCATDVSSEIPYLAGKLNKPGYVHEVKSAISEFMQYGIGQTELTRLIDFAHKGNKLTLEKKLRDLSVVYGRFEEYIREKYITTEESMDVLAGEIYKCHIVKDSTVIFDGFTGFTPVQNRVLGAIMDVAENVIFTLSADSAKLSTDTVNEGDLFTLTHKTFASLVKIAAEHGLEAEIIPIEGAPRYTRSDELSFLEGHFYRYDGASYNNTCHDISLRASSDIRRDVSAMASDIRDLVSKEGAFYRDIAVITGNPDDYDNEIEEVFEQYELPVYLDRNRGIEQNPFIDFITAALSVLVWDYDYDSVFRLLRTGFTDISAEETDILDNYVLETGIRGFRTYSVPFAKRTRRMRRRDDNTQEFDVLNGIRVRLMKALSPLSDAIGKKTAVLPASTYVRALYGFMVANDCDRKLCQYRDRFENEGRKSDSREYAQIYRYVCQLLEQIDLLIGGEQMDPAEFLKMIEAGLSEIEVGTIPQSVDRVIVGDMERTRLKPVKYLFFLGLNDGWVPKNTGGGGIISDGDREFLTGQDIELAPSPRQQAYIDRFYLYANLCKPSDRLYLSYVFMDNGLDAVAPSYMLKHIKSLFPNLTEKTENGGRIGQIGSLREAKRLYADNLREYAFGSLSDDGVSDLKKLHRVLNEDRAFADMILSAAFARYEKSSLEDRITAILYGSRIYASVSRIESYASCAYAFFLRYGLGLKEREIYGIEATDMGTIYHGVLEIFIELLRSRGLTWFEFDDETARVLIDEAVERESVKYTDAILFESESNKYIVERMKKVMLRTVKTIAYQLRKGSYSPYEYEYEFSRELKGNRATVRLNGKIDRVDTADTDDAILLKIVDYKSGSKTFSLLNFYQGVQLQMVIYMNRAMEDISAENAGKPVIPAAMLYYHIDDPIVEAAAGDSESAIEDRIIGELRLRGLIDDSDEVIHSLDTSDPGDLDVVKVGHKSDGSIKSASDVMSRENMALISRYADHKLLQLADRIASGDITADPKEIGNGSKENRTDSCRYCDFAGVCGFDPGIPGYRKEIKTGDDDEIMQLMRTELDEGGGEDA